MPEENSLEFDKFESARRNLTAALERAGRDEIEAERIALYVVQAIRHVPKLLSALTKESTADSDGEILQALQSVLDGATSLSKAAHLLHGDDGDNKKPVH